MSSINTTEQPDHSTIAGITRTARRRELVDRELKTIPQRVYNETGGQLRLKLNERVMEFLLDQLGKAGYRRSFVKAMVERHLFRPLLQLIFSGQVKEGEVLSVEVTDDRKKLYFQCPRERQLVKPALL